MTTGQALGGRYDLLRPLGSGGGGRVYEAKDTALGRRVAVKLLGDAADTGSGTGSGGAGDRLRHERFRREALALARVSNSSVVRVLDVGESAAGAPFMVMDLLDGVDLHTLTAHMGPLPVEVVCAVAMEVCGGLAAIHEAGIVHRDVKPSNIMITRSGRPVLFDFGLARAVDNQALTRLGTAVGTPLYMAPESVQGLPPQPATDLYGLGGCLHTMLTGRPPFPADLEIGEVVLRIVQTGMPPLAGTGDPSSPERDALAELVDLLVDLDPGARPKSAAEVQTRLPYEPTTRTWQTVRGAVADCVRAQALATVARPGPAESSSPEYLDDVSARADVRYAASRPTAWPAAGPRQLALSDATRQLVMSSMTAQNAASRQREAVTLVLRGQLQDAVRMLTAVVQVCSAGLGRDHPTTLAAEYWQAVCLARLDAGPQALALFSSVGERCEQGRRAADG